MGIISTRLSQSHCLWHRHHGIWSDLLILPLFCLLLLFFMPFTRLFHLRYPKMSSDKLYCLGVVSCQCWHWLTLSVKGSGNTLLLSHSFYCFPCDKRKHMTLLIKFELVLCGQNTKLERNVSTTLHGFHYS